MENTKNNRRGVYKNDCISPSEEKEQLTFIDFFAGVGGFRRGLELAGWKCVGFCEFDKYATASYTSMHLITEEQRRYIETLPLKKRQKEILKDEYRNGEWYVSDIRDANARNLPKSDCWCFGAPCQDFSVAGKRAGLDGDRSGLIQEIFRLLEEQEEQDRPKWLIYENVKGMLSSNRGLDYLSILSEMDRLGYGIEWQNINSKWFVPQNRERIYTVGHLRRFGSRKVFPVEGADGENSIQQLGMMQSKRKNPNAYRVYDKDGISPALGTMQGGGREPSIQIKVIGSTKPKLHSLEDIHDTDGIMSCLNGRDYKCPKQVAIPVLTPDRANKRQNGRRFKENGEPAFTLTAQDRHGVAIGVADQIPKQGDGIYVEMPEGFIVYAVWYEKEQCYITIRKLTPKECFRLQGWTDDYFEKASFVNSNSQLYKQAGNGVTVDVVKVIGERIVSSR